MYYLVNFYITDARIAELVATVTIAMPDAIKAPQKTAKTTHLFTQMCYFKEKVFLYL
jgi:hypothetical protein